MRDRSGAEWGILGTLAGLAGIRVVAAANLAPGRDELAYWWWATRSFDAGYSLVTTGAIRLATSLLGDTIWAVRLPGLLASVLAALVVGRTIRQLGGSRALAATGVLALAGSLWQTYAGTITHPDAWLTLWTALFGAATASHVRHPRAAGLVAPALWAALAAFTKLTGLVLFLPAAWLALRQAHRFPVGAATAGAILAGAAGWLASAWDLRTAQGLREFGRFDPGLSTAAQLGLTALEVSVLAGPALLLLAIAGARALRSPGVRAAWPAGGAALLLLACFAGFLVTGQAKGNWFLPAAVLLVPPGALALARGGRERTAGAVAIAGALVPFALGALILAAPSPWPEAFDRTYAWHTGERERRVSPARTWSDRVSEYRRVAPVDPRIVQAVEDGARTVASPDYGLAFSVVWRLGMPLAVWIPGDPVFASTCGAPPPGSDVVWVGRPGHSPPGDGFRRVPVPGPAAGIEPGLEVFRCRVPAGDPRPKREKSQMLSRTGMVVLLAAATTAAAEPARPDHSAFDALLHEHVNHYGVRYAAWHGDEADREALRSYVQHLQSIPISEIEAEEGAQDEALAYWINLYNAATLSLVLHHYPVDSIKDLGNLLRTPWQRKIVTVEGEELSLNDIENEIIRKRFAEPRIHFALNCAAIGCPPLRAGAYTAADLDHQLEQQTAAFLGDPERNWVDEEGTLHISKILDWYDDDFEAAAGSVLDYVRPYMPMLQEIKPGTDLPIEHVDYDWKLNEAPQDRR